MNQVTETKNYAILEVAARPDGRTEIRDPRFPNDLTIYSPPQQPGSNGMIVSTLGNLNVPFEHSAAFMDVARVYLSEQAFRKGLVDLSSVLNTNNPLAVPSGLSDKALTAMSDSIEAAVRNFQKLVEQTVEIINDEPFSEAMDILSACSNLSSVRARLMYFSAPPVEAGRVFSAYSAGFTVLQQEGKVAWNTAAYTMLLMAMGFPPYMTAGNNSWDASRVVAARDPAFGNFGRSGYEFPHDVPSAAFDRNRLIRHSHGGEGDGIADRDAGL